MEDLLLDFRSRWNPINLGLHASLQSDDYMQLNASLREILNSRFSSAISRRNMKIRVTGKQWNTKKGGKLVTSYHINHFQGDKLHNKNTWVAFDGGVKSSNGLSLNDILHVGPPCSTGFLLYCTAVQNPSSVVYSRHCQDVPSDFGTSTWQGHTNNSVEIFFWNP